MRTVTVRQVTIGPGMPKLCVPIAGRSREDILEQAAAIRNSPADLVEWRVDCLSGISTLSLLTVLTFLSELRKTLGDLPLLFTFRTAREGGARDLSPRDYEELCKSALSSGLIDLLDVELSQGEEMVSRLLHIAHDKGVPVIVSRHDFEKTPPRAEIVETLKTMETFGADIAKVAVMPERDEDVETLLNATADFCKAADIPAITISMGDRGLVSRTSGEAYGSAVTFGTVGAASAPGQMDAVLLKAALEKTHASLERQDS
ncbi:MAG: type I 3-dehydroquinate dehydratase [Clostridia bacterium]|nr:type I 3-dehydroquinate dehydratase [Clostridia bacterium]